MSKSIKKPMYTELWKPFTHASIYECFGFLVTTVNIIYSSACVMKVSNKSLS